jgi:ATP-binding cassette subfamily C (CFTR/MRP) protein 1
LFGEPFDLHHYIDVITNCALIRDLELLKDGDLSVIGDHDGVQLSGGQRQRIALARAVYANKETYIFDEPLSAVDAHVAQWLFDRTFGSKGALVNKTRIVVTHRIQFAPEADMIILMHSGRIAHVGTYKGTLNS